MAKFWKNLALIGGLLFIVILFSMVYKSQNTREEVLNGTEQRLYSAVDSATFVTNYGSFTIRLEHDKAPNTVTNFAKLASEGFYNGQRFHRVIADFMIQGGDPLSKDLTKKPMWGTGGPGYMFKDEFGEGLSNVAGTISMANAGPNTNGSQFFINVADNIFLDGKHAVFGYVVDGMDVVTKISQTDTDQTDKPLVDVVIEKVEIK